MAIFLDVRRTFEMNHRDILIQKLYNYGVRDELNWFKSYRTYRKQITRAKSSEIKNI